MPVLDMLVLEKCKLNRVPPGLSFHAKGLRSLCIHDVKNLTSIENLSAAVQLEVSQCPDLENINNLWKLQKLDISTCANMKVLEGVSALNRLKLEDNNMETLPLYMQGVMPRHLQLDCSLSLLTSIAAVKYSHDRDKFSHIQQFHAYAGDKDVEAKCYVLYRKNPFSFETNIGSATIVQACRVRKKFAFLTTWPVEEEWPVGLVSADKCLLLRARFRV
ncbi:hypothetical protein HU200_013471 [Digitaria exilis]|uniref:Uncharacterized protein n=1 Tax=Digitaria exilis TaxID=1010633 RepID=A0A835KL20_9POAL|nr:hypothetical protein HU200_013471 [Digitaria exilis]